jgi:hypothetical protein
MKTSIKINFSEYYDALKLSIHDDEWIQIAYKQKENIEQFTKQFCTKYDEAAIIYIAKKDFSYVLDYKTSPLNESCMDFFTEPFKESNIIRVIQNIKNGTRYIAENMVLILQEYSNQTRDFFEAEISPLPENINDTTKLIKNFKVNKNNSEFIIKLKNKNLICSDKEINNYLQERNINKKISRGFTNINLEKSIQELNFFKQTSIPTNELYKEGKYKVVFIESQAVETNFGFRTIHSENFVVKNIMRSHES